MNPNGTPTMRSVLSEEELREKKELGEAIKRLKENPDYKKVFEEKLFKDEPARLVSLIAVATDEDMEKLIQDNLKMISSLQDWLRVNIIFYDQAVEMENMQLANAKDAENIED